MRKINFVRGWTLALLLGVLVGYQSDYPAWAEIVVIGQACRPLTTVASTKISDDEPPVLRVCEPAASNAYHDRKLEEGEL